MSEIVSWIVGSTALGRSVTQSQCGTYPDSKKSSKIGTKLRELNKRLRIIYEDSGLEYGDDAKSQDELCGRFKTAVDLRDQSLKELFANLHLIQNVDLCFLIDATGSMQPHINGVRDSIKKIVDKLVSEQGGQSVHRLRLAMVAYRDFGDRNQYEIHNFDTSVEKFRTFCGNIVAEGGDDCVEDVFGGLNKAIGLNWDSDFSGTKMIFHIADFPCHGRGFHDNLSDSYPNGDPTGLTHTDLFNKMIQNNIQYYFGKITRHTDIMIAKFEAAYKNQINPFDVKNVGAILDSVLSSVESSMLATGTRLVSRHGSRVSRMREFTMERKEPNWNNLSILEGISITYNYPSSITSIIEDVPLERGCSKLAKIRIAPHPFARGAERIAYFGQDLRYTPPIPIVLKEYILNYSKNVAKRFECASQLQTIAAFMANEFSSALSNKIGNSVCIKFLETKTLAIGKGPKIRYLLYERQFDSNKFVRFTNNIDYQISTARAKEMKIPSHIIEMVMAFSHWSYKVTGGKIMVVDLQGIIENSGSQVNITLTDPAILSTDPTRFGVMNTGTRGMTEFMRSHRCNQYCRALKLRIGM